METEIVFATATRKIVDMDWETPEEIKWDPEMTAVRFIDPDEYLYTDYWYLNPSFDFADTMPVEYPPEMLIYIKTHRQYSTARAMYDHYMLRYDWNDERFLTSLSKLVEKIGFEKVVERYEYFTTHISKPPLK